MYQGLHKYLFSIPPEITSLLALFLSTARPAPPLLILILKNYFKMFIDL